MIMKLLYLLMLSILPVLVWMGVYTFLNPQARKDSFTLSLTGILFGSVAMIPVLLLQYFWASYPELNAFRALQTVIPSTFVFYFLFFLFVSVLEESLKAAAFVLFVRTHTRFFDQLVDGIVFGAFIALGFAFAENVYYFYNIIEGDIFSMDFLAIFSLRSFGTMLSHTLFTGTFGLFYAISYFGKFSLSSPFSLKKIFQMRFTRALIMPKLFKPQHVYRYLVLSEGMLFAILLHLVFNLLVKLSIFGLPAVYLTVPFLIFSSLWLWSSFFDDRCMDILKTKS